MKITLSQLQRQIGEIEEAIDSEAASATRIERKIEFSNPKDPVCQHLGQVAREIRQTVLPRLFRRLHHLQDMIPAEPVIDIARLAAQARGFDDRYRVGTWSAPDFAAA